MLYWAQFDYNCRAWFGCPTGSESLCNSTIRACDSMLCWCWCTFALNPHAGDSDRAASVCECVSVCIVMASIIHDFAIKSRRPASTRSAPSRSSRVHASTRPTSTHMVGCNNGLRRRTASSHHFATTGWRVLAISLYTYCRTTTPSVSDAGQFIIRFARESHHRAFQLPRSNRETMS